MTIGLTVTGMGATRTMRRQEKFNARSLRRLIATRLDRNSLCSNRYSFTGNRMAHIASTHISLPSAEKRQVGNRNKALALLVACVIIIVVAHLLLSSHAVSRRYYTCATCRTSRIDYTSELTSRTHSVLTQSLCSKWYQANIESHHNHLWVRSSTVGLINYYGQTIGVSDNDEMPGRVIWKLSPDQQLELYKHFDDPLRAKTLFTGLAQPEALVDRNDFSVLNSLRQWADSGFQEQWHGPNALMK